MSLIAAGLWTLAAAVAAPAPTSSDTSHVLAGEWKMTWPARPGSVNRMTIDKVTPRPGGASLAGRVTADDREVCAVSGDVYDRIDVPVRDGLDVRTVSLEAMVRLRVQCAAGETWIEAFGLPSGPVLMVGRATTLGANGARGYQVVHLGR